jgi:mannose-6-phosphate isomerase-like protein (cupin superfamily)
VTYTNILIPRRAARTDGSRVKFVQDTAAARRDAEAMANVPVNLSEALASFSAVYSPRIVGRVNDYDVRIAHARGEHLWHVHEHTDEFFLVLEGTFDVSLREDGAERTVSLRAGDVFVVPRGTEHKPSSAGGAILMFEPSGTVTTGDRHDGTIPAYVDSTAGHDLGSRHLGQ